MSYILDALRKSDQQRQRSAAPTLNTQATAIAPRQPAYWLYGLLAAALIGAGITIGWLRPWQSEQAAPAATIAAKPLDAAVPPTVHAPLPAQPEMPIAAREPAVQQPASVVQPIPAPVAPAMKQEPPPLASEARSTPARVVATAPPATAERSVGKTLADAPQEQKVVPINELPLAIQQELPKMSISVHAYASKPRDRIVGINDKMMREGESPSPGLRLEQITPEGMIFSYKEYRFRRGVQ